MKTPVLFLWILLAALVGGCATTQSPSANDGRPSNPSTTVSLTALQCWSLGCRSVEAPTCPAIVQDYSPRQWACTCANGSSCITEPSR